MSAPERGVAVWRTFTPTDFVKFNPESDAEIELIQFHNGGEPGRWFSEAEAAALVAIAYWLDEHQACVSPDTQAYTLSELHEARKRLDAARGAS